MKYAGVGVLNIEIILNSKLHARLKEVYGGGNNEGAKEAKNYTLGRYHDDNPSEIDTHALPSPGLELRSGNGAAVQVLGG